MCNVHIEFLFLCIEKQSAYRYYYYYNIVASYTPLTVLHLFLFSSLVCRLIYFTIRFSVHVCVDFRLFCSFITTIYKYNVTNPVGKQPN